jgi:mutator protein MutT
VRVREEVQALPRRFAASERLTVEKPTRALPGHAIHVVAAAVLDARGRVLIAQRPKGKHLAGLWEFPGGKVEPGEGRVEALRRELDEELGIAIDTPRPLLRLRHSYSYGDVLLDVWVVRRYRGEPHGLDGQALRWCSRAALRTVGLLPADRPIIAALRLPERLRVGETRYYWISAFADFMAGSTEGAARAKDAGGSKDAGSTGGFRVLRGVSCRNAVEARAAVSGGADFVALNEPVEAGELATLCESVPAPVFARGLPLARAWSLGASGVNALG